MCRLLPPHGPAGKMNPGTAAGCLQMPRLTRPVPQRWTGKPKKGSSTLYYTAGVYEKRSGGGLTDTNLVQRGGFKTATPLKSFNVKTIRNKTGKGTYVIQLDCYSDPGNDTISVRLNQRNFILNRDIVCTENTNLS